MLWIIILITVLALFGACIFYLSDRFSRFGLAKRIIGERKRLRLVIGIIPLAVIFAVTALTMNTVNAIICTLHLAAFWLICDLLFFVIKKIRKKEFKCYYTGAAAIAVSVCYLTYGWIALHGVWQTDYHITTAKSVDSIRIVQFADSHIGTSFSGAQLSEYLERMEDANPDVILITGDFVDDGTSKQDMLDACSALGKIHTKYGIYFSFGNHDKGYYDNSIRGYDADDLVNELEKNNVTVLEDESVLIDNRFYIVGRKDRSEEERGGSRESMNDLLDGLDTDKYIIVLDHQPNDYESQAKSKADLVLSGHTHGGQLIPINIVGELISVNDRTYGTEQRNNTDFVVTSGISDWSIKFKTGCKSEFVVIDVSEK